MFDKQEIVKKENQLQTRNKILEVENALLKLVDGENIVKGDTEVFPLKHMFTDGIYIRQMSMKKDSAAIGKIHKNKHVWFLLSGSMCVASETNSKDYEAPCYIQAPAGSKRVLYAHEDCVWVNVYPNPTNTKNLEELESVIIAKDYDEFEEYMNNKNNTI
jgi:quercetin dioxygenase-like cupin family protein